MNMILQRTKRRADGIFSDFLKEDGSLFCVAAEHAYGLKPKIVDGTYTCKRRRSPHFGTDVFEVMNVPGCTYIEIHWLNFPQIESDGCIGVGREVAEMNGTMAITMSRATFQEFMTLQVAQSMNSN